MLNAEGIGKSIISGTRNSAGALDLFISSAQRVFSLNIYPVRMVLYKQLYFTGIEALIKIAIIGALVGMVIITQVTNIVGQQSVIIGKILAWTVVRELGPLFCAIVIIARSCTAIATELGSMRVNREVGSIQVMGIDPIAYLIVPRIAGVALSVIILTFYFQLFAIIGGLALSSILTGIPFFQNLAGISSALGIFEIGISLLKSIIFGLVISTVSCYHGLRVSSSITEVPQMTTIAVMQSLFTVIILDGIISLASFI